PGSSTSRSSRALKTSFSRSSATTPRRH
ncbi:MAG: Efflux ABC transporter, ATP-binding protein, partial [uncultured Thermomicrobiales bacterium]